MSTYGQESNGNYTYNFNRDTTVSTISQGTFGTVAITGNVTASSTTSSLEDYWMVGYDGTSAVKHSRTVLWFHMPDKPSTGDMEITELWFMLKTGNGSGSQGYGTTGTGGSVNVEIVANEISIPATSLDMADLTWTEYDSGVSWANRGCDYDNATDYGFGSNGVIGKQTAPSDSTNYYWDLSAFVGKLQWGGKYALLFKTTFDDESDSSTVGVAASLTEASDSTLDLYIRFTDAPPEPPQISARPNIGGQSALVDVKVGGDKDLSDCATVWTNDGSAPEFLSITNDNDNIVSDSNPVTLNTANTAHFDAGILSAENTRYRVAVYSRDMASSYVDDIPKSSGITRSNIINLARPKILSVVINSSFNTIGVEGQLTVAATTGGAWSSYGAGSLKYLHIQWDGPATGATINDDGVSKIEITDTDATSVVHKHTYSSAGTKYVWVALEDTNGFMSGFHRIDDDNNNDSSVDNNIATPAALPAVTEADPICNITTSKSKFLAAKYADYNTGVIVSAAQSKAVGSNRKIQNYLLTYKAGLPETIVTCNAFDNDNSVFDDSSKRVAVRALTDIDTTDVRIKLTGLASFDTNDAPDKDTDPTFTHYKMVSELIRPPDAVMTEGATAGTASGGAAYNAGNYSFNYFKTIESAVVTVGDTNDTMGIRYVLTAYTGDWSVNDTGLTVTSTDDIADANELQFTVEDASILNAGDVIRVDSEFMKITAADTSSNEIDVTRQYLGTATTNAAAAGTPVFLANPIVINSDIRWASHPTDPDFQHRYKWGGFARILGEGASGIDFNAYDDDDTLSNYIKLEDVSATGSSFNDTCWYENGFFDDDIIMVGNTSSNGSYSTPKFYKLASFTTGGSSNYETAVIHTSKQLLPDWVSNSLSDELNTAADIVRIISSPARTVAAFNPDNANDVITFEARVIDDDTTSFAVNEGMASTSSAMVQPTTLDLNTVATYGDRLTTTDIAILRADISRDGGLTSTMPLGERKYPVGLTRTTMGLPTMAVDIRVLSQTGYKSLLSLIEGDTYDYVFMDSTKVDTPTSAYVTFRMKYVSGNLRKSPDTANEYLATLNFVIIGEAVTV